MSISYQNKDFEKIIEFSRRHRWAVYPCVCAAAAVYVGQVIGQKLRDSEFCGHAVRRIVSVAAAAAMASMTVPAAVFAEYAGENTSGEYEIYISASKNIGPKDNTGSRAVILKQGEMLAYEADEPAHEETPAEEAIAEAAEEPEALPEEPSAEEYKVTVTGLPAENDAYSIDFEYDVLSDNITIDMVEGDVSSLDAVRSAFGSYDIPVETLNILPLEINMYDSEGNNAQLKNGENAVVTLPVPEDMQGHLYDLRAIRVDGNDIVILDSSYSDDGKSISFETKHFSVFALVAYGNDGEDMSSHAGNGDSGSPVTTGSRAGFADFASDMKWRTAAKKRKFRVVKTMKKADLIF